MTVSAVSYSVPGRTRLLGAIDPSRLLLQIGEELALFDLATGAIVTRRAVSGLRYASVKGAWIVADDASGPALFRGDLVGDPIRWPEPQKHRLGGIVGSVAVFVGASGRMRFDLERRVVLERGPEDVEWLGLHEGAGLLLGVRERTREVVALRPTDGATVWSAKPFAENVDSLGHPQPYRDEVHVRASVLDDSLVARIGVRDGEVRGVRSAPSGLDSWLPDLGAEVDRKAMQYERAITYATLDGIVIPQDDQVVVVRASGIARIAKPPGANVSLVGNAVAAIVTNRTRIELLVIPLPATGDHDLEIVLKGPDPDSSVGVPAVVTFAGTSAPIVIVQHPKYGRINLTRELSSPPPPIGAHVVLDGVEVTPGGTARVDRWSIAGVAPPHEKEVLTIGLPAMAAKPPPSVPTRFAESLARRVENEGMPIPDDVSRFLKVVDREPAFRRALADLGILFDEDELGLDVLPELEIEGFVPIWGSGYGDGYGGLTKQGVAFLWVKGERTPCMIGSIGQYVRSRTEDVEARATVDLVLGVLAREEFQ